MMIRWTRRELRFFIIWSLIVTVLYEVLGFQWLQVPWTALALIGTAVAFLIGFQSNAVYGRLWEARQIWGGIVNDSRMFMIMILDIITNEHAKDPATDEELASISNLINHQGKTERIKNFSYPRQFATLEYDFVNIFTLLLPFGIFPEFSKLRLTILNIFPIVGAYFVWFAIPFSTMVSWVFNTMQRIGTVGENPFEGSTNDVPISTISMGIEIDLLEMFGTEKESIPKPYPIYFDTQM